ncbi:MAG TPA: TetR family transcriptional regulator [Solirubrobacteraceae bacterium]|nr:TetR family transcriptional regulator [Solirubrobacteraceae bacterium]
MAPAGRGDSLGRGARDRILAAAGELFARQGFNATRINDLHVAARVSKRTLYQHFDSKGDLILAYLATYGRAGPTEAVLTREDLAPRTRLLEIFTALADPESVVPDPIVAAAIEFPDRQHPVHRAATDQVQRFTGRLTGLARAAGARNPERTARRLATLYDGACCRLLLEDVTTVVEDVYVMAAAILRDAID